MDIVITRHPEDGTHPQARHAHPGTDAATSPNPWAAPRAHYAQVKRVLSWQSCVFQRGASLIKPQEETPRGQPSSECQSGTR
jgi:hypothetical protein